MCGAATEVVEAAAPEQERCLLEPGLLSPAAKGLEIFAPPAGSQLRMTNACSCSRDLKLRPRDTTFPKWPRTVKVKAGVSAQGPGGITFVA